MGRPINNKNFGNGAGKLAIKFYDGSAVVEGKIVSQIGSRKFKVTKADGSGGKIVRLATTASELTALTAGTGADSALRPDLGTIEVAIFGGATENVKSLMSKRLVTLQGTSVKFALGVAGAATGDGTIGAVADAALSVANAIPDTVGTVAAAFSYVVPANTFAGGNLPLTYSMSKAGTGSSVFVFDAATRTVSKPATSGTAGTTTITITATDADGSVLTDAFDIVVS